MSFGSTGSVEERIKSLEKLNIHRGSKYDVTKDGRQWLETVTALDTCICFIPYSLTSLC